MNQQEDLSPDDLAVPPPDKRSLWQLLRSGEADIPALVLLPLAAASIVSGIGVLLYSLVTFFVVEGWLSDDIIGPWICLLGVVIYLALVYLARRRIYRQLLVTFPVWIARVLVAQFRTRAFWKGTGLTALVAIVTGVLIAILAEFFSDDEEIAFFGIVQVASGLVLLLWIEVYRRSAGPISNEARNQVEKDDPQATPASESPPSLWRWLRSGEAGLGAELALPLVMTFIVIGLALFLFYIFAYLFIGEFGRVPLEEAGIFLACLLGGVLYMGYLYACPVSVVLPRPSYYLWNRRFGIALLVTGLMAIITAVAIMSVDEQLKVAPIQEDEKSFGLVGILLVGIGITLGLWVKVYRRFTSPHAETRSPTVVVTSRGFVRGILRFLFWAVIILGTTMLSVLLVGNSGRQQRPMDYYWCQFLLLVPLVFVSWASCRRAGPTWDWLFALLVSLHAIVLQLLFTFDLWSPSLPLLKGFMLGLLLVLPALGFAFIRRLFQRRASFALAMFFLFTISQVVVTSLLVQGNWHRDSKATGGFNIIDHRRAVLLKYRLIQQQPVDGPLVADNQQVAIGGKAERGRLLRHGTNLANLDQGAIDLGHRPDRF
ncbi:MAG: hypothetical protein VX715_03745 [Planctomycetota bacterium]|nr:hypothetical protein [Planctomycetota bacterium]